MSLVVLVLNVALIALIAAAAGVMVWHMVSSMRLPILLLLFLILPVGQLFILNSFSSEAWSAGWLVGVLLGLLADVLLLVCAISLEKKTAAEEELKELQHKMELEKSHFGAVQSRREMLAELRRDFKSRLEDVAALASDGKDVSAREMIANLTDQINLTLENPYCAIPVVNAVLMEKEKACRDASIDLSVDLDIPSPLDVSPMHLCSIFSNILDNAIAACPTAQGADRPLIQLSSLADGDYLFIKVTNPSGRPKSKPAPGRGYGLRILSELAKRYDGDFQSDFRDGVFTVVMSLLAVGPVAEG